MVGIEAMNGNPEVEAASKIANKAERLAALTEILRQGGAPAVAASRELRVQEKEEQGEGRQVGPPPPTSKMEQVARLVRMIVAVGPDIHDQAVEILNKRQAKLREIALMRDGFVSQMQRNKYRFINKRRKKDEQSRDGDGGAGEESDAPDGQDEFATDEELRELSGAEDAAGQAEGETGLRGEGIGDEGDEGGGG